VRVALFVTCLVDGLFPDVGKATVGLLERLGCAVEVPLAQTCCGQMHVNTGYLREAVPLVRRHVAAFDGYDAVVVPSGSCAGSVRHQHAWLASEAGDPELAAAAREVASRTFELSEFLVDVLGVTDVGAFYPHRVTYHPTCHSLRVHLVGHAGRQDAQRALDPGRGLLGLGQLVPAAHRRRAVAAAGRGAHRPPGRDPGLHPDRAA